MPAICCWLPRFDAITATSVERRRHLLLCLWLMFRNHGRYSRYVVKALLGRGRFFRGFLAITPVESIHTAGGIDQFLFAGKEGMAGRTNLNMQIALAGRTGLEGLAAGAGDGYLVIFRVNSRLHFISRLL